MAHGIPITTKKWMDLNLNLMICGIKILPETGLEQGACMSLEWIGPAKSSFGSVVILKENINNQNQKSMLGFGSYMCI